MLALFYFEVAAVAHSGANRISHNDLEVTPASNRSQVAEKLEIMPISAILLPTRSLASWLVIEQQLWSRITMPRILVVSSKQHAAMWTPELADNCGFDGFHHIDTTQTVSTNADEIVRAIERCTSSGARPPKNPVELPRYPTLDDITAGDKVNLEIINEIVLGNTYNEIAAMISLSPQTVRNRVAQMLQRALVGNRSELAIVFQQLQNTMAETHLL
jgi:DNA-binding NarL/FixJ family response regulator